MTTKLRSIHSEMGLALVCFIILIWMFNISHLQLSALSFGIFFVASRKSVFPHFVQNQSGESVVD